MGVQGLLALLKSIQKPVHLRNFAGKTLGIDGYGWLHRGTSACPVELVEGRPTRRHIDFVLHQVRMLIHFGVKPFLVFDGDALPSKAHTQDKRAESRQEGQRLGLELLKMGKSKEAYVQLRKAVRVTPMMARELIEELKMMNVSYLVAPYEADSQLAYLEKQGIIDGVISEDSDMLVFGIRCLLTKLDQYGECVMIKKADFTLCREVSFMGWTDKEFRMMAMLSGCDYLPGLEKIGLKTAYALVRKHKTIERLIRAVQFEGKTVVPAGYLDSFQRADRTFLYQWVYCPRLRCLVHLNPLPTDLKAEEMPYIGSCCDAATAVRLSLGELDPRTKTPLILNTRLASGSRRTTYGSTPDEKSGKSIAEFFKPTRTPLAELDPNSFTPSPSQQRLLQTNQNASWSATQAAVGGQVQRITPVGTTSRLSASLNLRRALTEPTQGMRRSSPKRQRLCGDATLADVMGGTTDLQSATSRFFAKQTTQQSPSVRKASSKSSRKEDFELWSDDSAAELVAAATATPESTQEVQSSSVRKQKKLAVFRDGGIWDEAVAGVPQEAVPRSALGTVAQEPAPHPASPGGILRSQSRKDTNPSQATTTPEPKHGIFSKGIRDDLAAMRRQASAGKRRDPSPDRETVSSDRVKSIRDFKFAPLLDRADLTEDVIPASSPVDDQCTEEDREDGRGEESEATKDAGRNGDKCCGEEKPDRRASSASRTGMIGTQKLQWELAAAEVRGSEDLLIPASPCSGNDEEQEEAETDGTGPSIFKLDRFVFVG